MATYVGSDNKRHRANIIGLKPSNDYGEYIGFANCSKEFDFDNMFKHKKEWNDENTPRSVYVFTDNNLEITKMEVEFEINDCMDVELSPKEKEYLKKEIKTWITHQN